MAGGSELSCLSSCTGMLAHITLRNASSNVSPAGPHSLTQQMQMHTPTHRTSTCKHTLLKNKRC